MCVCVCVCVCVRACVRACVCDSRDGSRHIRTVGGMVTGGVS